MSENLKVGIFFGSFMAVFYVAAGLWDSKAEDGNHVLVIITGGIIGGAMSGTLFSFTIFYFARRAFNKVKSRMEAELLQEEKIIFATGANHYKGREAVGGGLFLTNANLIFKSHKLNIQNHTISIPIQNIISVSRYSSCFKIFNNGLIVSSKDRQHKFVVQKADVWVKYLQK